MGDGSCTNNGSHTRSCKSIILYCIENYLCARKWKDNLAHPLDSMGLFINVSHSIPQVNTEHLYSVTILVHRPDENKELKGTDSEQSVD